MTADIRHFCTETYDGFENYETWNVALSIGKDVFLYNTARACVRFAEGETPWIKFVRCMTEGQIGRFLGATADGVKWNDPAIDSATMNRWIIELDDEAELAND